MESKNSYEEMKQFAKKYAGGKTKVKQLNELKEQFKNMLNETECTYADLAIMTAIYQKIHNDSELCDDMLQKLLEVKANESN